MLEKQLTLAEKMTNKLSIWVWLKMGEQSEAKTAKKSFESKDSGSIFDVKLRSELFRFATVRTFNPNSNNPLIGYFLCKG